VATFVLIHGAWHGGWCWDETAPLLRAAGHSVFAPDLPGMGRDKTPLEKVDLSTWTLFVSDLVVQAFEPVVLVGHSRGGIVISEVAEIVPDRIQTLVYLAAFLAPNGKTLADMLALETGRAVATDAIVPGDGGRTSTIAPAKVAPVFYNTTPPALQARAASLLGAEPMMSFTTPVRTSATRYGRVRRAYIECTQDNAVPLELQRAMQRTLPCKPVVTLETDHSPFFSAPGELTQALDGIAAETSATR
jgi:pimeloyl-ACP methyl ester carboxylesterase